MRRLPAPCWQWLATRATFHCMDTAPLPGDNAPVGSPETEAERHRRIAWEADRISEARAELDAGLFVDAAEIDAWIDSIGTDHELPPPPTRRR